MRLSLPISSGPSSGTRSCARSCRSSCSWTILDHEKHPSRPVLTEDGRVRLKNSSGQIVPDLPWADLWSAARHSSRTTTGTSEAAKHTGLLCSVILSAWHGNSPRRHFRERILGLIVIFLFLRSSGTYGKCFFWQSRCGSSIRSSCSYSTTSERALSGRSQMPVALRARVCEC